MDFWLSLSVYLLSVGCEAVDLTRTWHLHTDKTRGVLYFVIPFFFEQFYFTPIFLDFTCKRARGDFVQGGAGVESKLSRIHTPIFFF